VQGENGSCASARQTATVTVNACTTTISTSAVTPATYCSGDAISIPYTTTGTFSGNTFTGQISTSSTFSSGIIDVGTLNSNTDGTISGTIPSSTASGTYYIRVIGSSPSTAGSNSPSTLAVTATPTVPTGAAPSAVCEGTSATINASGSTGATAYTFWNASTGGIQYTTGGGYTVTTASLTTPSSLTAGSHTYYIQGENGSCTSSRQAVTVTVNAVPSNPSGTITPAANPACGSTTVSYSSPSATIYWQTSSTGTSTAFPTTSPFSVNTTGTVYARAYNGNCWSAGTVNSGSITIHTAPAISSQPSSQSVTEPAAATFTVTASNATGYQWEVNTGSGWSAISGANTSSYSTGATTVAMDGYQYRVVISGNAPCSSVTSNAATLTVNTTPWEDFEIGSKGAYALGNVTCTAGSWTFNNALLGSLASDLKNGSQSARIQATGSIAMNFDLTAGLGTVTLLHGMYGSDASGTWHLEASTDGGSTWNAFVSSTYTSANSSFATQTVTVNLPGTVRFRIIKEGGGQRLNIDDIYVTPYDGPDINVQGNGISILSGDASPASADNTDYGNADVTTGSVTKTYTIQNLGTSDLAISGVTVTGANASDYSVTTAPASPVAGGSSTTFQITFNPSATGVRSATVTINSDDADEDTYTFAIQGTGVNSTSSDIITYNPYAYTTNIDYTLFQGNPVTNTSNSVGVFKFLLRDGGSSADADNLGTELNAITFNVANIANIRSAAIFGGGSQSTLISNAATINTGAGTLSFSGLSGSNVTANDNSTQTLTLRVSFQTAVIDNQQLQFTVASATANASLSSFAVANAGGATSSILGDTNRIEVTADRIRFTTQPADQAVSTNLATFTIKAVDGNGNVDADAVKSITLTTSGTGMTSSSPYTLTGGILNISDVQFNAAQTGITLTATTTAYADNDDVSSPFNIVDVASGSYRSTSAGNWSTATWERFVSGWASSTAPASNNTTDMIYIRHAISTGGSISPGKITIERNGTFTISASSTVSNTLVVKAGGTLQVNASLTVSSGANFEVEDTGKAVINFKLNNASAFWNGTENFHPYSTFVINEWDASNATSANRPLFNGSNVTTNTYNGYTAAFGNIEIDLSASSEPNSAFLISSGVTANLAHNDLYFIDPQSGRNIVILNSGTATSGIGGDFKVDDLYSPTDKVLFTNSGSLNFTIKGNMQLDGSTTVLSASGTAGTVSNITVEGNMNVTAAAVFDFSTTIAGGSPAPNGNLNLQGDLTVAASGLLQNSNTSATGANGFFNFTGPGDGLSDSATQTIDIASTSANENRYITFSIKNGAYVKLINRDFEIGERDTVSVENGGVLDFGFNGNTPLLVKISGSQSGTTFRSLQGSTLKITSPDGITTTSGTGSGIGNVQTISSNRSYNQVATFHYIGKTNQVTGNGITSGSSGKIIICELTDNNTQLSFTNSTGITNNTAISATGGKLDIRKGQVIESTTAYIDGSSGTLYMSPGTLYKIPKGNSTITASNSDAIPRISGGVSNPYILTGGIIELSGSGASNAFQTVRNTLNGRPHYINLKFSGANTYGTDFKNMDGQTFVDSALIITGTAVVDCRTVNAATAASFTGSGGLVMDGGRLRLMNVTNVQPELIGDNVAYSITGGTVEMYGTSATQQQQLRGNYTSAVSKPKINYYNVEINADAANWSTSNSFTDAGNVDMNSSFSVANIMTVYAPAVFRMDETEFIDGAGKIVVSDNAGLLYSSPNGISATGTSVTSGNIRTSQNDIFSSNASYGFIGNGSMITGTGLPSSVKALYTYKSNIADRITLTNSTRTDSLLKMNSGHLITGSNRLELGSSTANRGTLNYTTGYVIGNMRRWFNGTNSGTASGLFPMGQDTMSALYNRHYYIQFTNAPSAGGYLDVNFNNNNMGLSGLPINIPAVGSCPTFDVTTTEDQGYWVGTPQAGTLQDGFYTLSLTGESFITITELCQLTLLKRVGGGGWTTPGIHLQPTGNTNIATVSRSGMSGFSNFGFGGGPPNPLPVELVSFTGNCQEDGRISVISWTTLSEKNTKKFVLQRSSDGRSFINVAEVKAAGFSNMPRNYAVADSFVSALNYYRLREIDNDGQQSIFTLIQVKCSESSVNHIYYSAPKIVAEVTATTDKQITLNVFDVSGQLIHHENKNLVRGYNKFNLDVRKQLAGGVYIVETVDGSDVKSTKVLIH
jgi:hypothetical protein